MLNKDHRKIISGRRDFLKTASIAGVAVAVPGKNLFKQGSNL